MGTIHSFMQLLWVIPSAVIAKTNDTKCQSMCFHCVNLRHIYHRKCQCCSEFLYKPNKCAPDNSRQAEMSLEPIWSSTRLHTNKPPSSYLPRAMFPSWLPTAGTNTLHSWCLLLFFFYIDFNMQYQQSFIALAAWWCLKWELNIGRSLQERKLISYNGTHPLYQMLAVKMDLQNVIRWENARKTIMILNALIYYHATFHFWLCST